MIEFQRNIGRFKIMEIWFSDEIYDVDGVDAVYFGNARFHGEKHGFSKEVTKTLTIDLNKSIEDLWYGLDRQSTRNVISKALSDSSYVVRFNEKFEEFSEINREFRTRKGLPPSLLPIEEMKNNYFLSTFEKDGVVLGGQLCIKDDRKMEKFLVCNNMTSNSAFSPTIYGRASRLSLWKLIEYAKQQGCDEFDLGGYATGKLAEDLNGANKFKKSFGGVECDKYAYSKSYSKLFDTSKTIFWTAMHAWQKTGKVTKSKRDANGSMIGNMLQACWTKK